MTTLVLGNIIREISLETLETSASGGPGERVEEFEEFNEHKNTYTLTLETFVTRDNADRLQLVPEKPYLTTALGVLYQGDALKVLSSLDADSIDCIIGSRLITRFVTTA